MPDARAQARTVAEFWAVELDAGDHALLNSAFERDGELRGDTAAMFGRLVELDLRDAFVEALVRRLRALTSTQRPVRAVMPALGDTLAAARSRGRARAVEGGHG